MMFRFCRTDTADGAGHGAGHADAVPDPGAVGQLGGAQAAGDFGSCALHQHHRFGRWCDLPLSDPVCCVPDSAADRMFHDRTMSAESHGSATLATCQRLFPSRLDTSTCQSCHPPGALVTGPKLTRLFSSLQLAKVKPNSAAFSFAWPGYAVMISFWVITL